MSDPSPTSETTEPDEVIADDEFEDLATTPTTDEDNAVDEAANAAPEAEPDQGSPAEAVTEQ